MSDMNEPTDLASQLDQIFERPSGRALDEMRAVTFETGIAPHANGSVLCSFGNTRVICSAMIEYRVPGWMRQQKIQGGWLTAEYSMLPYATLLVTIAKSKRPLPYVADSSSYAETMAIYLTRT